MQQVFLLPMPGTIADQPPDARRCVLPGKQLQLAAPERLQVATLELWILQVVATGAEGDDALDIRQLQRLVDP
ncbi:hypothetical protein D9M71_566240 [compost metagenome]